jgi:hypothetical protein
MDNGEEQALKRSTRAVRIALISIMSVAIMVVGAFLVYASDYYRADATAVATMANNDGSVYAQDGFIVFSAKEDFDTALVFYPGGKVEYTAYAPLLEQLSQHGIASILLKMPFNLAVFDTNAADRVLAAFPHVRNFYLAGHSLGGAMASSYMEKNSRKFKGLVLLGAYPLNDADVPTLAIYGSLETGWDRNKLKSGTRTFEIEGGNHAQFGNYGAQKGDATATISREEQQALTVQRIVAFVTETKRGDP